MTKNKVLITSIFILFFSISLFAQLQLPQVSPRAVVMQQIGLSEVRINYGRPAVNDREVWGSLVPYKLTTFPFGAGNPAPWRAGANENTTVSFTHDAVVNGKPIKAGTYGFHIIPYENKDWVLIFSNDNQAWGSFFYDESHDALRVTTKPVDAGFIERLEYGFDEITNNSVRAYLHWEKKKVPFTVEFDATNIALKDIEAQLTGISGFNWQAWNQAAVWGFQSGNLEHAEKWVRKSIALNENATNRNMLGYVLKSQGKNDQALAVFKENVENYPTNWNVYDSYGEMLKDIGNTEEAIDYYKKAMEMAPDQQKTRIQGILDELKS